MKHVKQITNKSSNLFVMNGYICTEKREKMLFANKECIECILHLVCMNIFYKPIIWMTGSGLCQSSSCNRLSTCHVLMKPRGKGKER